MEFPGLVNNAAIKFVGQCSMTAEIALDFAVAAALLAEVDGCAARAEGALNAMVGRRLGHHHFLDCQHHFSGPIDQTKTSTSKQPLSFSLAKIYIQLLQQQQKKWPQL